MSSKIPQQAYELKSNLLFIFALTLWIFLFAVVYTPTFSRSQEQIDLWNQHESLCIPILCAISFLTTTLSRLSLYLFTRQDRLNNIEYLIWQFSELIITCLFADLFLCLLFHVPYFSILPPTLLIGFLILIFPYTLFWLFIEKKEKDLLYTDALQTIANLRKGMDPLNNPAPIKFIDEKGNIKLIVSADRIISIESAGNYVNILYDDNGTLTRFPLRNTLKAIEELCNTNGLVRCHRSWVVNLRKIKLLRKEPQCVFAEMTVPGVKDVPVSKNYAADVAQQLANI